MLNDLAYVEQVLGLADGAARERRFRDDARLRRILPEVYRLEGVPQPPRYHPEGDVFAHTLLAVRHLPQNAERRLAWAALLHDVGKALTTQVIRGRIRAFGHDRAGAELAAEILARLDMPAEVAEEVVWLVRHHMFALSWQVDDHRRLSRRQRRFIGAPGFPLLLDLMRIDALAAAGSPDKLAQVEFYRAARARLVG